MVVKVRECFLSFHAESFLFQSLFKIKIHGNIIFPAVFNGCETWSLKLREERRQKVLENSVLSVIIWPMKDDATEEYINYMMTNLMI